MVGSRTTNVQSSISRSELHGWNRYGGSEIYPSSNYYPNQAYNITDGYLQSTNDTSLIFDKTNTHSASYTINGRDTVNGVKALFYYGVDDNSSLTINGESIAEDKRTLTGYKYTFELRNKIAPHSNPRYPKHFVIAGRTTPVSTNVNTSGMLASGDITGWTFVCEYEYTGTNADNTVYNNTPHFFNPGTNHNLTNCNFVDSGQNGTDINGRTSLSILANGSHRHLEYHIIETTATDLPLYSGFAMFILDATSEYVQIASWNVNIEHAAINTIFEVSLETEGTIIVGKSISDLNAQDTGYKLDVSGNVRIAGDGTFSGDGKFSGDGTFSGSVTANGTVLSSDDRIKHNETIPATPLNTIMKMTPKHYFKTRTMYDVSHNFTVDASGYPVDFSNNRLVEGKDYTRETGIIAQDLQSIPELNYIVKNNGVKRAIGCRLQ